MARRRASRASAKRCPLVSFFTLPPEGLPPLAARRLFAPQAPSDPVIHSVYESLLLHRIPGGGRRSLWRVQGSASAARGSLPLRRTSWRLSDGAQGDTNRLQAGSRV